MDIFYHVFGRKLSKKLKLQKLSNSIAYHIKYVSVFKYYYVYNNDYREDDMDKINIALIGCGTIANGRHIPAYLQLRELYNVRYCVDLVLERAERAAANFAYCKALADYSDILNNTDIDAVVICTPNGTHGKISIDFARAGKHILCEKPLSVDYESGQNILEAVRKAKIIMDVGLCNRYRKSVIKIKELIEGGVLGDIYHIYCSFRKHRSIPGIGRDFTTKAVSGGGVLIDWGVHLFDIILYTCGIKSVKSVSADTYNKLGGDISAYNYIEMWAGPPKVDGINDVEDMVSGYIRTDGPSISFNGAWAQNLDEETMYIEFLGDKGGIKLDYYGRYTLFTESKGVFYKSEAQYNDDDMFYSEIKAFGESIQTGRINHNNIENVMELHRLLDIIYKSAEKSQEIAL